MTLSTHDWVWREYQLKCCDRDGNRVPGIDLDALENDLIKARPRDMGDITIEVNALRRFGPMVNSSPRMGNLSIARNISQGSNHVDLEERKVRAAVDEKPGHQYRIPKSDAANSESAREGEEALQREEHAVGQQKPSSTPQDNGLVEVKQYEKSTPSGTGLSGFSFASATGSFKFTGNTTSAKSVASIGDKSILFSTAIAARPNPAIPIVAVEKDNSTLNTNTRSSWPTSLSVAKKKAAFRIGANLDSSNFSDPSVVEENTFVFATNAVSPKLITSSLADATESPMNHAEKVKTPVKAIALPGKDKEDVAPLNAGGKSGISINPRLSSKETLTNLAEQMSRTSALPASEVANKVETPSLAIHAKSPEATSSNVVDKKMTSSQEKEKSTKSTKKQNTSQRRSKNLVHPDIDIGPERSTRSLLSRKLVQTGLADDERSQAKTATFLPSSDANKIDCDGVNKETSNHDVLVEDESDKKDIFEDAISSFYGQDQVPPSKPYQILLGPKVNDHANGDNAHNGEIRDAPLLSQQVLDANQKLIPQFGLLGSDTDDHSVIYQNTNVPLSSFICGVQGSGKSHTTSCMIENALINSPLHGHLEAPLSAMVFAYDSFTADGNGFNISEAAFLAAPHAEFPTHPRVRKVTVLVSPSNPVISRLYKRIPNVTVIPFRLNPRTLTVDTILTLMAVGNSNTVPLYLAQMVKILRQLNVKNQGFLDYFAFKKALQDCKFNGDQLNMLQLRLDLLESFLDMNGNAQQPTFRPGEITIMDMSCPFVDANTACLLFKLGLDLYNASGVPGKMVILDEAHKYMLDNPGSQALNNEIHKTVRLQRHRGARLIVSTQEPTLLTDLIALCSVTVIHRFSSPEWFNALKRHIPVGKDKEEERELLREIEGLRTGTALVYSPSAVFGLHEERGLVKGIGRLVKMKIRKRVTSDGGQSVLAM